MTNTLKMLAIGAVLAAGASSAALAQTCPPGYALYGGVCQPAASAGYTYAPNNPVSGAASGAASRAAAGGAGAPAAQRQARSAPSSAGRSAPRPARQPAPSIWQPALPWRLPAAAIR